jgi:peptidyl-prolyl cis-trans isomerase B (cyclophilin B)
MKRLLFCWIVALSLGILQTPAQDTQKKDSPAAEAKAATPPAPPSGSATAAAESKPSTKVPVPSTAPAKEVAVIKTSMGEMVVEFWPDVAPKHVENFKSLAKKKFYDGTAFHRVISGFMIQGGDPLTKDESKSLQWGTGSPGYTIKAEFNNRKHVRGVLSMARGGDPDSAGSQFFICLGPAEFLDNKYTAFGKLIKGDDVLEKIGSVPVGPGNRGENSRPVNRVGIESVKIVGIDTIQ